MHSIVHKDESHPKDAKCLVTVEYAVNPCFRCVFRVHISVIWEIPAYGGAQRTDYAWRLIRAWTFCRIWAPAVKTFLAFCTTLKQSISSNIMVKADLGKQLINKPSFPKWRYNKPFEKMDYFNDTNRCLKQYELDRAYTVHTVSDNSFYISNNPDHSCKILYITSKLSSAFHY